MMTGKQELEYLRSENISLRNTVDILSRALKVHYERSRGAEYVEARAERIEQGVNAAVANIRAFRADIINALDKRKRRRKVRAAKKKK